MHPGKGDGVCIGPRRMLSKNQAANFVAYKAALYPKKENS
jgi:hypothetical protein